MKIEGHIDIRQARDIVAELFADPKRLGEYQEGFLRKEVQRGEPGQDGTVSRMYYRQGKGEMELIETITANRLPDSFAAEYHHKAMDNTMLVRFEALGPALTRYHYEYEYTELRGFLPKLIARLLPSVFRKPAEKWLRNFKEVAERAPAP
jgi:hypothetical protein